MNTFFFLQNRLNFYHMLVFKLAQDVDFLHQFIALLQAHLVDFSDENPGHFASALLTLSEGVVLLHRNNDLLRHSFVINNKIKKLLPQISEIQFLAGLG